MPSQTEVLSKELTGVSCLSNPGDLCGEEVPEDGSTQRAFIFQNPPVMRSGKVEVLPSCKPSARQNSFLLDSLQGLSSTMNHIFPSVLNMKPQTSA